MSGVDDAEVGRIAHSLLPRDAPPEAFAAVAAAARAVARYRGGSPSVVSALMGSFLLTMEIRVMAACNEVLTDEAPCWSPSHHHRVVGRILNAIRRTIP